MSKPILELISAMREAGCNSDAILIAVEKLAKGKSKATTQKGTRLPEDWSLPPEWVTDARRIAHDMTQHITPQDVSNEAAKFRDYWIAKPGAGGCKLNWRSTWSNWFRSYLERRPKPRDARVGYGASAHGQHGGSSIEDVVARRALQRRYGNGVPDDSGWGHDVPAEADCVEGQYRLVG